MKMIMTMKKMVMMSGKRIREVTEAKKMSLKYMIEGKTAMQPISMNTDKGYRS
jgi:hypothetical protein